MTRTPLLSRCALIVLLTSTVALGAPEKRQAPDVAISPAKRDALVKSIANELRTRYVFPDRVEAAIAELNRRWSTPAFLELKGANALLAQINLDLQDALHDKHLRLHLAAHLPPGAFDDPEHPDPGLVAQEAEFERQFHYGVMRVEVLPGNVGYLRIGHFAGDGPGVRQAYADALAFVRDTDSLIIDVRDNGGGDGDSVAQLVGFLLDKRTLLQEEFSRISNLKTEHSSPETVSGLRYGTTRDVFVLTSGHTFSAAEEFAYDLQTQKRATLIGEKTGGGANHNMLVRVADDFALSVPYGYVRNVVTGTNWERVGVQPDVAVKADDAQRVAERIAIERQLGRERDPERKEYLKHQLAELAEPTVSPPSPAPLEKTPSARPTP